MLLRVWKHCGSHAFWASAFPAAPSVGARHIARPSEWQQNVSVHSSGIKRWSEKTADSRKFTITLLHTYLQTHAILLFGSRKVHPQYKKQKLSIGTRQLLQEGKATNTEMIHGVLHLAVCFGAVILRHCTLFLEPQLRKNRLRTPKDFETAKF